MVNAVRSSERGHGVSLPVYSALVRGVAQSGSAPGWGPGGRRFKSSHPDCPKPASRAGSAHSGDSPGDSRRRVGGGGARTGKGRHVAGWSRKPTRTAPSGTSGVERASLGAAAAHVRVTAAIPPVVRRTVIAVSGAPREDPPGDGAQEEHTSHDHGDPRATAKDRQHAEHDHAPIPTANQSRVLRMEASLRSCSRLFSRPCASASARRAGPLGSATRDSVSPGHLGPRSPAGEPDTNVSAAAAAGAATLTLRAARRTTAAVGAATAGMARRRLADRGLLIVEPRRNARLDTLTEGNPRP